MPASLAQMPLRCGRLLAAKVRASVPHLAEDCRPVEDTLYDFHTFERHPGNARIIRSQDDDRRMILLDQGQDLFQHRILSTDGADDWFAAPQLQCFFQGLGIAAL